MSRAPRVVLVVLVAALVGLAVGCSGDDDGDGAAPTGPATSAPTTNGSAPTSSGAGRDFCVVLREVLGGLSTETMTNPDLLRQRFEALPALAEEGEAVAPDSIREDFTLVVDTLISLGDMLDEVDYDVRSPDLDPEFVEILEDPEYNAANGRLDDHLTGPCGGAPGSNGTVAA